VGVTLASTAPIGVSPALSLPISSPVVGANTTLNMIFSVWLYLVLIPPYHVQH
jgi:hypothetical protein